MSEISVSKITNIIAFKVDQNSYSRAIKAIRKVASEWNKVASKVNNPMAQGRAIGGGGRGSPRTPRVSPADRAQEVISAGNIRRQSMYGTGGASSMAGTINSLNSQLKSGAISLQVYRQQVAAVEREFRRAQASATTFGDNLKGLRTVFIALTAGNVLFTGGRAVMQTGQMFQGIEAAMSMTSDGASETASKMQYLREEAYRLGLDLKIASQGFVQLSVSANKILSGSQTQELFTGMSEYATALGLDAFRYEKALLGFTQIANKGQLMAEEVKNQIGEQLPGALDLFVAAASEFTGKELTTPEFFKMMQDGELLAKDILPLMGKMMSAAAKKGGALEKMLLSNGVAMRRLTQTWQNFQNEFFKGGFGQSMTDTFNVLAQMLKDNTGLAGQLGKAFKAVMDNLLDGFTLAYDIARMFWWEMDDALFSKIPEGMKTWLADNAALLVSITIATGAFKLMLGTLRLIFGLGSLGKGLGLAKAATEAGKVLTIFERMQGFLTGLSALVTRMTGLAIALSSLNKDGSIFDFSNLAKSIIPGSDITGLNTFSNIMNPNSALLAPFRNQPSMPTGSWATAGQQAPQKVQVEVRTTGEFGSAIEAKIIEGYNRTLNQLGED